MTIKETYRSFSEKLNLVYSEGEAAAICRILFEDLLSLTPSLISAKADEDLSSGDQEKLNVALEKLLLHTPVQYVTGHTIFCGLPFIVNENVLIPRPETEELVHEVINALKNKPQQKILDIGTGSGCIPVSIKKNIPQAEVIAVDLSNGALETAKKNAAANHVDVKFHCIDFTDEAQSATLPSFDIIISNPPYIPENEKELLDKNVTAFEPHLALFVPDNDPLMFYRLIHSFAKTHLNEGGKIFLEMHEEFAKETAALFTGNYSAEIKKDINGKERMLIVTRSR